MGGLGARRVREQNEEGVDYHITHTHTHTHTHRFYSTWLCPTRAVPARLAVMVEEVLPRRSFQLFACWLVHSSEAKESRATR